MPSGFIITQWTDEGLEIPITYPDSLHLEYDDLMRIFYAHITGAGQAGNLVVRLENIQSNVSSFFNGMDADDEAFMVNLVLDIDEEPDLFGEDTLQEINLKIIELILKNTKEGYFSDPKEELAEYLKFALYTLERLEKLSKEQRIAQIYSSRKGKCILDLLQERPRSKGALKSLVEDKLKIHISNFETTLDPFFKADLIHQDWVEGFPDIYLFLKSDFVIYRKPPETIVSLAKKRKPTSHVAKLYQQEIKEFFRHYQPSPEDSQKLARVMINPDLYSFIALFREKSFQMKKLPKSSAGMYIKNEDLIRSLEKDGIVKIFQDKDKFKTEWVFLFTDIAVKTFFPSYLIENIRKEYSAKNLAQNIAVKGLSVLEKAYTKN